MSDPHQPSPLAILHHPTFLESMIGQCGLPIHAGVFCGVR
jgi:hypothetical protein